MEGSRYVRLAHEDDIAFIAENMRESDRMEVWTAHRHTPLEALQRSMRTSILNWTIEHRGNPVAMFGVGAQSALGTTGYPWLLGTYNLKLVQFEFLRWSKYYVGIMREMFDYLENWVDVRNVTSIKWLSWCGFTLADEQPWGHDGLPFRHFFMESANV